MSSPVAVTLPCRAVLFDLDGTLVDSLPGITAGLNTALTRYGVAPVPAEQVRPLIGAPLERIFATLLAAAGATVAAPPIADLVQVYLGEGAAGVAAGSPLFPGVLEVLDACGRAGVRLAVVTTKRTPMARAVLAANGIGGRFQAVVGADAAPRPKPYPDQALAALAALGVSNDEAAVVGDTDYDVQMALAAGSRAIGVTWGYGGAALLRASGATALATQPQELPPLFGLR